MTYPTKKPSPYVSFYLSRKQGEAVEALVRAAGAKYASTHILNAALRNIEREMRSGNGVASTNDLTRTS